MQTASSSSPTAGSTAPSITPTRTRLQNASPTSETDMLRLAIITARKRLGTYVGAFLALFGSAVLVMAGGMLLRSALQRHAPVTRYAAAAAARLAGHPCRVDAIGILGGPGLHLGRVRVAAPNAAVLTSSARGNAESPSVQIGRTQLIAVAASFGGLGMFIAIFIVARTMALIIQQREHEIALLRAVAATPGQVRRMIAWEAVIVSLVASAAGVVAVAILGKALARGFVRHEISPADFTVTAGRLPATVAIVSGVTIALLAVLAAGRRASRVAPTRALADAAVEPRGIG